MGDFGVESSKYENSNNEKMTEKQDVSIIELNHSQQLTTKPNAHFSALALLGLSYAMLNTWGSSAGSIYIGLGAGGPVAIVYGTIVGTVGALSIATSLAEMCHVLPTAGAQYHWFFALSDKQSKSKRFFSYMSGWLGTAGWIALTATAPISSVQILLAIIQLFHPQFNPGNWFTFIVYMAVSILATIINIFGIHIMGKLNIASLYWSITGAVVLFVTLLSVAGHNGQLCDAKFIFATFLNDTGWPDGVAWIMGLLMTQFALVGADGAAHLVDEIKNPRKYAPLAMVLSCLIGGFCALVVNIALLAVITDPEAVIEKLAASPMIAIYQGIGNLAGTTILSLFFLVNQIFTMPALTITTSRMIHAYAIDGCLPFKSYLGHISPRYQVPIWAIMFNFAWITVFGLMALGSSLVILIIQSASVVMLQVSYIPVIILMVIRGRKWIASLDFKPTFNLGPRLGFITNLFALFYISIMTIFFLFPSVYPVTSPGDMNYAVVVFIAAIVLGLSNWFLFARKHYEQPNGLEEFIAQITTTTSSS
ncbi:hypothetical protein L7F22_044231 [Adiantum nelumboides]|nr:hypothetical protein [Adiantum nelumboides]